MRLRRHVPRRATRVVERGVSPSGDQPLRPVRRLRGRLAGHIARAPDGELRGPLLKRSFDLGAMSGSTGPMVASRRDTADCTSAGNWASTSAESGAGRRDNTKAIACGCSPATSGSSPAAPRSAKSPIGLDSAQTRARWEAPSVAAAINADSAAARSSREIACRRAISARTAQSSCGESRNDSSWAASIGRLSSRMAAWRMWDASTVGDLWAEVRSAASLSTRGGCKLEVARLPLAGERTRFGSAMLLLSRSTVARRFGSAGASRSHASFTVRGCADCGSRAASRGFADPRSRSHASGRDASPACQDERTDRRRRFACR